MKTANLVATLSAAALAAAQPAAAATGSASSISGFGGNVPAVDARAGSSVDRGQGVAAGSDQLLLLAALIGFAAALVFVVLDDDSFDDLDELPASP